MSQEQEKRSETKLPQPPLDWYVGLRYSDVGITNVLYSDVLTDKNDGEVGKKLADWAHHGGRLQYRKPEERDPEEVALVEQAAAYIKQATGFCPEELQTRRFEIQDRYEGKQEAPFHTLLIS